MWTKMSREIGWDGTFNPSKAVHSIVHCLKQQQHKPHQGRPYNSPQEGWNSAYCTKDTQEAGHVKAQDTQKAQDARKADHVKSQAPVRSRGAAAGVRVPPRGTL